MNESFVQWAYYIFVYVAPSYVNVEHNHRLSTYPFVGHAIVALYYLYI